MLLCHAWTPPPRDTVKCNSYGSYQEAERRIGGCGVIRDHLGLWVTGCYSGEPEGNAFKAEATTLKEVLELAWNRGLRSVICDVDCADLVATLADAVAVQLHSKFLILNSISQLLAKN
ncbi:uncharacterized protein LOC130730815 [Lotus japonicus]|uniref:uncharacterized protein LOC130730815 n=1 Tax=Lotus japonicus TaxID=34305 RepID=UPI002589CD9D|nr:uncharacterized protein LOC130730815 [Lotus japonicus]